MNTWPNKPLILITKGAADGCELKNVAAIKGNAVNAYQWGGTNQVSNRVSNVSHVNLPK